MFLIQRHPEFEILRDSKTKRAALTEVIAEEIQIAVAERRRLEALWVSCFKMYEAIPSIAIRNIPIEKSPNIEVPIGQTACDIFNAAALKGVFSSNPVARVKIIPGHGLTDDDERLFQRWIDWGIANEYMLRSAAEDSIFDTVQLGTGIFYVPWTESIRKTRFASVISHGPRIFSWPLENIIVPSGSGSDIDLMPWISMRTYLSRQQLILQAKVADWDISNVSPVGKRDRVYASREQSSRKGGAITDTRDLFEIHDIYIRYDWDDDDIPEDLLVTWDNQSKQILRVRYNPYNYRPLEAMRYQRRGHLFYGMGILEKLKPIQEEISDIHNHRNLNMLLANTRMWKAKHSVQDNMTMHPNKVIRVTESDDFESIQMAEIYPSSHIAEQASLSIAERLVGMDEMSSPRPSQVLASRTPNMTAMSMLNQFNQRFEPTFNSMAVAVANAIKQCQYRYAEALMTGNASAEQVIDGVLGKKDGERLRAILLHPQFDNAALISVEAATDRASPEAKQQNYIQLAQILTSYYEKMISLTQLASNMQVPQPVRSAAAKVASAAGELVTRMVKSFDNVSDPEPLIVKLEEELAQTQQQADQTAVAQMQGMMSGLDHIRNARLNGNIRDEQPANAGVAKT